jgi:hypothetical protein
VERGAWSVERGAWSVERATKPLRTTAIRCARRVKKASLDFRLKTEDRQLISKADSGNHSAYSVKLCVTPWFIRHRDWKGTKKLQRPKGIRLYWVISLCLIAVSLVFPA